MKPIVVKSLADDKKIICVLDLDYMYRYIMNHVSIEVSNLVESCYYPKIANMYRELLHMCNTNETLLIQYSKEKYGPQRDQFKIIHDPFTTLLILIVQEYLKVNNIVAAQAAFHLFSLRTYSNTLYHFTTSKRNGNKKSLCLPDIFQQALESLSGNHIFKKKSNIAASIIYFSSDIFSKNKNYLKEDNSDKIFLTIYSLKNRIKQSLRSLMNKYYEIYNNKVTNSTKDESEHDLTKETKLKTFISRIADDMCIYRKRNSVALQQATSYLKFNRKLSVLFSENLAQPAFIEDVRLAYYLLLKDLSDLSIVKQSRFLDYIKRLMSIKSTKQKLYFKKVISDIHMNIINNLHLNDWYNSLTIQSKSLSRNWIAYYMALYIRYYI